MMKPTIATHIARPFRVLITNDFDGHPSWKWAETTADQLVSIDHRMTDPFKIRAAVGLKNHIVEVLTPLMGQPSRPKSDRVVELILQASERTPWDRPVYFIRAEIKAVIEKNLNTIYRSND